MPILNKVIAVTVFIVVCISYNFFHWQTFVRVTGKDCCHSVVLFLYTGTCYHCPIWLDNAYAKAVAK